jgi:hypothetical protein
MNQNFLIVNKVDGVTSIYLAPEFMNLAETQFPAGVLIWSETFEDPSEEDAYIAALNNYFNLFVEDYKETLLEEPEFFKSKHFTTFIETVNDDYDSKMWTSIYWDGHFSEEHGTRLLPYVRLVVPFMDNERAGFSHGLSVFNRFFETEDEAFIWSAKLENYMNSLLTSLNLNLKK